MQTKIINIIGAPSSGKTLTAALLFAKMKIKSKSVEYVPEFVKKLVWEEDFDSINNQYYICQQQYKLLKSINGKVEYIITDGALLHTLLYNEYNVNNVSDIKKTEKRALELMNEFENIYIYIERNENYKYEESGRYHSEKEAQILDSMLKEIIKNLKLDCIFVKSYNEKHVDEILNILF